MYTVYLLTGYWDGSFQGDVACVTAFEELAWRGTREEAIEAGFNPRWLRKASGQIDQ